MSWEAYFWPGTEVLRNKLGILDAAELDRVERQLVSRRLMEGPPTGNFDLQHLQAIHRHLFQDVYEWAGELRDVRMQKGASVFMPPDRIEMGMADVHRRLEEQSLLQRLDPAEFARQAAEIIGDVNHVHPFREGNGRTQVIYLQQLGAQAGHVQHIEYLDRDRWIEASVLANAGDYTAMQVEIGRISNPVLQTPEPESDKGQDERAAKVERMERARQERLEAEARVRAERDRLRELGGPYDPER